MAQILPTYPTVGEKIGTGLGAGLQLLAQQKMEEYGKQQKVKRGIPFLVSKGFTEDQAESFLNQPESTQKVFLAGMQQAERGNDLFNKMQQLLNPTKQGAGREIGITATPTEGGLSAIDQLAPAEDGLSSIDQLAPAEDGFPTSEYRDAIFKQSDELSSPQPTPQEFSPTKPTQSAPKDGYTASEKRRLIASTLGGNRSDIMKTANDIEEARTKAEQHKEKQEFEKTKLSSSEKREEKREKRIEQHHADTITKDFFEETNLGHKSARDNRMRGKRISKLNTEGDLGSPHWNAFVKTVSKGIFGAGIDISYLMTADAIEMDKLSADYLKDIKNIFGARITESMIQQFLKTVPTLSQSKEGRERVIRNLDIFGQASDIRYKVMNEIIDENNGERPKNLSALVDKRAEEELDRLAAEFEAGGSPMKEEKLSKEEQYRKKAGFRY